jgi:hypothetical protein
MNKHHTKEKGDKGVGFVIADLLSKNIHVCIPISEHLPFDLIGLKEDGSLIKISVKYRTLTSRGLINVQFRSIYSDSKGVHIKKTDKSMVDIMAIYCPETNKVYYINPNLFNKSISLRIVQPQKKHSHMLFANDYLHP